jgi:predicted permease
VSPRHDLWVRLAARRIPERYRDEILADLLARHHTRPSLVAAILKSASDARRQMKAMAQSESERATHGWGDDVWRALRYHVKHPAGALGVVLVLAVAIGLNTALFSMVQAVLLRPLTFDQPDRVAFVWTTNRAGGLIPMAPARALDLSRRATAIESAALIGHLSMNVENVGAAGEADRWPGASVSSSFFDVLGTAPEIGRTFRSGQPDKDVVVLSHALWMRQWHGDPGVVGRTLVMNGRARLVLGVMPADFYWPSITPESSALNPPLFWTCAIQSEVPEQPIDRPGDPALDRQTGYVRMVARLKPGISSAAAQASLTAVAAGLSREFPTTDDGLGVALVGARAQMFGPVERPMLFIWLASAVVVLGACVNVGTLILVRQAGRRREFAVRSALGGSRARLTRQLVTETLVLALAGGVIGVVLAGAGLRALVAVAPESVGRLDQVSIDGAVLAAAIAMSMAVGIVLGALAAAGLWRDRSATDLRGAGSAETGSSRVRQTLIALEAALAVVLVVVATLFGESLVRLYRVDVGFDASNLLTFNIALTEGADLSPEEGAARQVAFYDQLLERLRAVPGVLHAGAAVTLPIGGDDFGGRLYPDDRPLPPAGVSPRLGFQTIEPGWFDTLGMPLVQGRDFNSGDSATSRRVVIVNQALAESLWPRENPLGKLVRDSRSANAQPLTVVGVVGNIHHNGPAIAARPEFYRPFPQEPFSFMAVALRVTTSPTTVVPAVRAAVAELNRAQPISEVSTMAAHLERTYGRLRFLSTLTVMFGGLALVLAVIGIYGVTSFSVAQRRREFGVRMALGASPRRLMAEVLRASLTPALAGAMVGLGMAFSASAAVRALLFGTPPTEWSAYLGALALLVASGALGGLVPARRAAAVDPVKALRDA